MTDHQNIPPLLRQNPRSGRVPLIKILFYPLIIVVVFGAVVFSLLSGKPEQVFLVNGLEQPYDALVNGVPTRVEGLGRVPLPVAYGKIRVDPVDGGLSFDPIEEKIETSIFRRGGKGPLVIINPDRTALFHWRKAVYFDQSSAGESGAGLQEKASLEERNELRVGKNFYVIKKIDAAFAELPENVQLPSASAFAYRFSVNQITDAESVDVMTTLLGEDRLETAVDYARHRLTFFPRDTTVLMLLTSIWEPEKMMAFLETKLDERPILVEWHRYYQQLVSNVDPDRDLLAHYRALHGKEPGNRDVTYLMGRLIENSEESLAVFHKAILPPEPSAFGYNAIAYHHMQRGDFEKALEFERHATKLAPENLQFKMLEEEMLLATKKYDELIRRRRAELVEDAIDQDAAVALNALLALSDRKPESQRLVAEFFKAFAEAVDTPGEWKSPLKAIFDATYAQGIRDLPQFAKHCERVGEGDWLYYAAVVNGNFAAANDLLIQNQTNNYLEQLLLYTLAIDAGQQEFANERLQDAVALLQEGPVEQKHVATWFGRGAAAPGLEEVYAHTDWPANSRVVLTALGMHFPRMKDVYFAAAEKLNYDPLFPGLVLDGVLAAKAPTASQAAAVRR